MTDDSMNRNNFCEKPANFCERLGDFCERLMDVTDEELQSFGYNDEP